MVDYEKVAVALRCCVTDLISAALSSELLVADFIGSPFVV